MQEEAEFRRAADVQHRAELELQLKECVIASWGTHAGRRIVTYCV